MIPVNQPIVPAFKDLVAKLPPSIRCIDFIINSSIGSSIHRVSSTPDPATATEIELFRAMLTTHLESIQSGKFWRFTWPLSAKDELFRLFTTRITTSGGFLVITAMTDCSCIVSSKRSLLDGYEFLCECSSFEDAIAFVLLSSSPLGTSS